MYDAARCPVVQQGQRQLDLGAVSHREHFRAGLAGISAALLIKLILLTKLIDASLTPSPLHRVDGKRGGDRAISTSPGVL